MKKIKETLEKTKLNTYLIIFLIIYAAGTTLMNIWAGKTFGIGNIIPSEWNWTTGTMFPITTGGTIISWLVFACMDIITEIWGKKFSYKVIICMAIINVLFSLTGWLVSYISPNETIFDGNVSLVGSLNLIIGYGGGLTLRMSIASVIAFIIGSYFNTLIFDKMHKKDKKENKISFIIRAVLSTIIGQLLDNTIFMFVAFSPLNLTLGEKPILEILTCIGMTSIIEIVLEGLFDIIFVSHFINFIKQTHIDEISKLKEEI